MTIKIYSKKDYLTKTWTGGETTQFIIYPREASLEGRDFIFRISSATCPPEPSKFSDFTGYQRYITPLDRDFTLSHKGERILLKPFEMFYFDGSDDTSSLSEARDFNLILKKGYTASYRTESISQRTDFSFSQGGIRFIFIPEGNIRLTSEDKSWDLEVFDSVVIEQGPEKISLESLDNNFSKVIIIEVEVD